MPCFLFSWVKDLKEIGTLIETGAYTKEVRRIVRTIRHTIALRRKLTAPVLSAFLHHILASESDVLVRLSSYLSKASRIRLALPVYLDKIFHPSVVVVLSVTFVLTFGEILDFLLEPNESALFRRAQLKAPVSIHVKEQFVMILSRSRMTLAGIVLAGELPNNASCY
ncbi:putative 26S proteasome non-ATPase regulatory subunit 3 [Nymphaea thermarum]|nr:putative 26S proteasome non-ATPase regulatory subunit 3 [Nymphaea thermarum]